MSYYQSDKFLNEIRKKSTATLKVKGLLSRVKQKTRISMMDIYKKQLTTELIKNNKYVEIYEKYNNIPDNLHQDVYNALLITLFTQDELDILDLYNYEEPSIAFSTTTGTPPTYDKDIQITL